jgi:hypothetical protein
MKKADKRGSIVGIRLNDAERAILEKRAQHNRQKLSDWARETLLTAAGFLE